MKLKGRSAIITGASQGLGFEIARHMILQGTNVMLCARNAESLYQAQQSLAKQAPQGVKVLAKPTDVSNREQVESLFLEAYAKLGDIQILIANAGIYGPIGPLEEINWQEWSEAIDINLKGTVLPCLALLKHFKKQRYGKIIILSGGGATKPMPNFSAYAASKAGVVRFAETLAEEVKEFNIDVNAIAPGGLNTRLLDEVLEAGPAKVGQTFYEQSLKQKDLGGTSLSLASTLCTYLASNESDGITGRLLSAVWDPWTKLSQYSAELKTSDIYTMRRITPKDRGFDWDEGR